MRNFKLNRIIISIVILSGFLLTNLFSEEKKEKPLTESEKIKLEIQALMKGINEKNEKARALFMEAKIKADSLKQEAEQKLAYLGETIEKARQSVGVDKIELGKAVELNKEAKELFQANEYIKVLEKVKEALSHISKVPVVSITVTPQLFSPGEKGENTLMITPDIFSINKVVHWALVIKKKEEGEKEEIEIKTWSSDGELKEPVKWDGKSEGRIILDSAGTYAVELTVTDDKGGVGRSSTVKFKTDIFVTETERGKLINISSIKFDYFKYDLKDEYKKTVKMVYNFLLNYPEYRIIVEGHSDASGPAGKNTVLSGQRAKSVSDYLIVLGIDRTRVKESGLGEALPQTYVESKMGLNRRVSFILLKNQDDINKYDGFIKKLDLNKEIKMRLR